MTFIDPAQLDLESLKLLKVAVASVLQLWLSLATTTVTWASVQVKLKKFQKLFARLLMLLVRT